MMTAQTLTREARSRVPCLALCVLGLLGALACNGSIDTQQTAPSSRRGTETPSSSLPPASPTTGTANAADTDPTDSSNEQANDIGGISSGASARGGARGSRAPRPPRANPDDAGVLELDAGADDAGVLELDAGANDAGAGDGGARR